MNKDLVTLVNEQDEVLGSMDKIEAHRGEGKLHRAISVFLFRKNSGGEIELLIQKRSVKKIVGAGQWANTVCGNVWPDESYEDCARRRLSFELGITDSHLSLTDIFIFRYQTKCNEEFSENEIDHIFAGWFDEDVMPNPEEVAECSWIEWQSLQKLEIASDKKWAPWFKMFLESSAVMETLESYAKA